MNAKAMVPLVLAVVLGLTAALLVRSAMSHRTAAPVVASNLVTVVVAKQDKNPGDTLTPEDVGTAKVPAEVAPSQVFSDPMQLVGRVTVTPLVRGQTILDTLLAPTGTGSGLQSLIPPGMRAVTLEVTEFSGVAGMLEPGCKVDVVSVMQDAAKKGSIARTVLQDIKVSAVGRQIAPAHPQPGQPLPPPSNSITLLCTPKQVQTLQLATNTGRPWLVLRQTSDGKEVSLDSTTLADLQGVPNTDPNGGGEPPVVDPMLNPQPTQNPVVPTMDPAPATPIPSTLRKSVTVISGGVESQVQIVVPNPRASTVAPLDQGDVFPMVPGDR